MSFYKCKHIFLLSIWILLDEIEETIVFTVEANNVENCVEKIVEPGFQQNLEKEVRCH